MTSTIGVRFCQSKTVKYVVSKEDFPLLTWVVVKDSKGSFLGQVCQPLKAFKEAQLPDNMPYILRQANTMDLKAYANNAQLAQDSKPTVKEMIASYQLGMKVIDISFPLERNFVLITFTAEERVDFRQLLKELASFFKTRIELRQLNSRQEAKVYGGIGPCGRPLCCSTFLGEFPTLSIKMLKNQSLSLNSIKNLGNCGRLLCCLQYEDAFYVESKKKFPDYGSTVKTSDGEAKVVSIDIFTETLKLKFDDKETVMTYDLEEVIIGK
ncbi:regulatory iron-sulfur-containing complex subunit RicT [Streptococcus catagoni]|uniref:regulatory iron-sulfur-containing complex subunit RicT n=1 Tax=Streptococcus catagoni TaxID=2654874 RepID=UPI00140BD5DB|nr:regulatory iron-sulfur-containing complex subunit RicT [Streptococcus catagoni]